MHDCCNFWGFVIIKGKLIASLISLAKLEIKLEVSDDALAKIATAGFDPVYGARPLKRAIQSEIENPLAKQILEGKFAAKDTVRVGLERGRVAFEKTSATE